MLSAACLVVAGLVPPSPSAAAAALAPQRALEREARAVWVGLDSPALQSQAAIAEAMDNLAAWGFNTVFVQVLDGAQTLYPSPVMAAETGVAVDRRFERRDLLAELVVEAHRAGLELFPWLAGGLTYPSNGATPPLATAHADWLCKGPDGLPLVHGAARWFDWQDERVQAFASALLADLAQRYEIDGVQLDDRFPAVPKLAAGATTSSEARAAALTEWLGALKLRLRAIDPSIALATAPLETVASLRERAQDTAAWRAKHIVDLQLVQAADRDYAVWQTAVGQLELGQFSPAVFQRLPAGAFTKAGDARLPSKLLVEAVAWSRAGSAGQVSFTYSGLLARGTELPNALRTGPFKNAAAAPWRDTSNWRPRGMIFPALAEGAEGPWHVDGEWPDFHVLDGGVQGSFGWWVQQPHAAWFDVHVWVPAEHRGLARQATYLLQGEQQRTWVELDLAAVDQPGWVRLGSVELRGDELAEPVRLVATETSKELHTPAGPILLTLNRRLSPDVRW